MRLWEVIGRECDSQSSCGRIRNSSSRRTFGFDALVVVDKSGACSS
jgi:hypothetical protein